MESDTTRMERQQPAVKRTYGSRKPAAIPEDSAVTSGSELTNLSQLTGGVRSDSSDEPTVYNNSKNYTLSARDDADPSSEADDSGYSGKLEGRKSIAELLGDVDEAFDNAGDEEVPQMPSLPACEKQPSSPALNSSPSVNNDKESPRFPPSEATQVASDVEEDVEESEQLVKTAKAKGLVRRSKKAILDSEDEEEEAGDITVAEQASKKVAADSDDDDGEERLPEITDAIRAPKPVTSDSDDEMEAETQETEDIEQYRESQDGKKAGKARKGKDPKVSDLQSQTKSEMALTFSVDQETIKG